MMEKYMKSSLIAILAILSSSSAYAWGPSHSTPPTTQSAQYVLPGPPTVLASPGVHQSGNDCAPDNAEAVWSGGGQLGYVCVRPGN
jgi:hypothetical protein